MSFKNLIKFLESDDSNRLKNMGKIAFALLMVSGLSSITFEDNIIIISVTFISSFLLNVIFIITFIKQFIAYSKLNK